jgi:hypothetical protein
MKPRTGSALFLASLIAPLVFAAPALATESRIHSMGGGVKLWTVEDESNIFDFPSLLVRWGNRVYVDRIQATTNDIPGGHFGFHFNLSDETVIAFIGAHINSSTNDPETDPGAVSGNSGFIGTGNPITGGLPLGTATGPVIGISPVAALASPGAQTNAEYRYGLMFATQLGAKTRFGLSLNVLGENNDVDSPNNVQTDNGGLVFDIGIGLGVDLAGSELEPAAGVEFGLLESSADNQGTGADLEEVWSGSHFGLRVGGRWTFDFFNQTKIVTYTQFLLANQDVEQVNTPAVPAPSGTYSALSFILGADLRIEPFQGVIVSPGLGFYVAQQTLENPGTVIKDANLLFGLPFYGIAVDLRIADWVSMRFGAQQFVDMLRSSTTTAGTTQTTSTTDVTTTFAWGLGFNIPVAESAVAIDLCLNPTFLNNGPHILSGTSTGPFALNAALRYAW